MTMGSWGLYIYIFILFFILFFKIVILETWEKISHEKKEENYSGIFIRKN